MLVSFVTVAFLTFGITVLVAVLLGLMMRNLLGRGFVDEPLTEAREMDRYQGIALKLGFIITFSALLFLFNFIVYERIEIPDQEKISWTPEPVEIMMPPATRHEKPEPPKHEIDKEIKRENANITEVDDNNNKPEDKEFPTVEPDDIDVSKLGPPPIIDGNEGDEDPFPIVEEMPEFPGGEDSLIMFISKNYHFPLECFDKVSEGTIYVRFIVEKDGSVSMPTVIKGVDCPYANKEAERVISIMPRWKPSKQQGRPVRVYFILPIKVEVN